MNKDYYWICGGFSYVNEKGDKIVIPPESAKDTSKEKEPVTTDVARDNIKNMIIQVQRHKPIEIDGKTTNRILRDGRNIKAGRNNNIQEQDEER